MSTFIKDKNTTTKMKFHILISLMPIIVFCFYKNGVMPYLKGFASFYEMFYPIIFLMISSLSTFVFETIYRLIFNKNKNLRKIIFDNYSYIPGLFLGLILPINTPLLILIFASFLSVISKMIFEKLGNNIFNSTLLGKLIIIFFFSSVIMENGGYLNTMEVNTLSSSINTSIVGVGTYNELVAPYGNLWNFFIGTIPGALGETSVLLCIIAFIYLTITKTIKWRISVCYVMTVFIMSLIISLFNDIGIWYSLFQILSGGLMFGAVFLATDSTTSPITKVGQLIYGVGLGVLTIIIRHSISYQYSVLVSILIMNTLVNVIDLIGVNVKFKKNKIILILTVLTALIVLVSLMYAIKI